MVRSCEKSTSRKKKTGSFIQKFPSPVLPGNTTTVTAPYDPISSLFSVSSRLREVKSKRKFQTLPLKVVAVTYERWSLTKGSQCNVNFWYFGKPVAEERWLLTRGGRNPRFDCISYSLIVYSKNPPIQN